jgi:hypothetical protein
LKSVHYDFEDEWLDVTPAKPKRFINNERGRNIWRNDSFKLPNTKLSSVAFRAMKDTANPKKIQNRDECNSLGVDKCAKVEGFNFSGFLAFGHWRLRFGRVNARAQAAK